MAARKKGPCGLVLCRDGNAARNILARGRRAVRLPEACARPAPEGVFTIGASPDMNAPLHDMDGSTYNAGDS